MASKKTTRKSTSKKKTSHYPVVRSFPISAGASANTLVDMARGLSAANRRLMRFGRYYQLKVDVRPDYAGSAIEVFVLRDDWAVQKAFQMAYKHYMKSTATEREAMGNQVARWEDFRVQDGLVLAGGVNQAVPVLATNATSADLLNAGEFEDSEVVDENGTNRTFTWGNPGATQYGLLQEFDKSGNAQTSPSSVVGGTVGPYSELDADNDAQTYENLEGNGNSPPYDRDGVNALSPWVRIAVLGSGAAGQQRLSTGFFTAPCGLVVLKGFTETSEAYSVTMEAKSGDYKGVHAPSMLE